MRAATGGAAISRHSEHKKIYNFTPKTRLDHFFSATKCGKMYKEICVLRRTVGTGVLDGPQTRTSKPPLEGRWHGEAVTER